VSKYPLKHQKFRKKVGKMLGSTLLQSTASSSGVMARPPARSGRSRFAVVRCVRDYSSIPKGKPWKPSYLERMTDELPFVQRIEEKLSDYCTTLEGEECCSCWEAYHELQDLEKNLDERKSRVFPTQALERRLWRYNRRDPSRHDKREAKPRPIRSSETGIGRK
jgi:hypothetical protein